MDEDIGKKTANSLLIDMNLLFERFVVNLLKEGLGKSDVEEQKRIFLDSLNILDFHLAILSHNKKPLLIEKGIIDNFDLSKYNQNLSANPQIKDQNVSINSTNLQTQSQIWWAGRDEGQICT